MATVRQDGLTQGGYAEVTAADPALTLSLLDGMPFDEAAAFYIAYQTAWVGIHRRAHLRPGEVLLVHAAAGGVGSAAVQLGKAAGARVIATSGSPEKVDVCRELGADLAIDYSTDDFVARVKEFTDGRGADVIWDPVGGDILERSTKCIAFEGRLITVGFTSGQFPAIRANHLLVKNYTVLGLHWGLYRQLKPEVVAEATHALFSLYADGKIKPYISERRPLRDAAAALAALSSRQTTGKVVLTPTR
jgi:NADPH2:quinone reductase